jgi:hypothetical protein
MRLDPPHLARVPEARTATTLLHAIDLTSSAEHRRLWRPMPPGVSAPTDVPGLGRGFALPMGFWITESGAAVGAHGFTIVFEPRAVTAVPAPEAPSSSSPMAGGGMIRRPEQTVRLKPPNPLDNEVVLKIGPAGVRVSASETAWKAVAEPVILAVGQYWRFALVEREIERLTDLAHFDHAHATMPTPASLGDRKRLAENARAVRELLIDLPHFEGPLTDPYAYCATETAALTYLALVEKLRLEEWCELIDEKAEAIEDTYEAVSEKLFEYKNFAWEAALETIIIVILLGELALMVYELFGPA